MNNFSYEPKSDESMVIVPKRYIKKLIDEHKAKDFFNENKIKTLEEKVHVIGGSCNDKTENNNMSEHSQVSVSSIFKKKGEDNKSEKNIMSQQGGNKSDKKVKSHKSEEQKKNKKNAKIKSESESENESITIKNVGLDESSSEYTDSSSDSESDDDSTSYEDTSDIYRATETDDEINKAYSKINREMEEIERKQNKGKMTGKEVIRRINFLLNGLRILDNVKRSNKKKK